MFSTKESVCELVLIPNYSNYISMRLSSQAHKNLHLKNFVFYTVENITHLSEIKNKNYVVQTDLKIY